MPLLHYSGYCEVIQEMATKQHIEKETLRKKCDQQVLGLTTVGEDKVH